MDIAGYLDQVRAAYDSGHATEHSYRPALHALFQSIDPALTVINEPKRGDAGMVDFMFERKGVPFGWAEAKDIDKDVIRLKGYSIDQRRRYERAYPNLIYTNGVDFEFIREGQQVHFVSIADFVMGLQPNPDRFEELERQLRLFAEAKPISIRSAAKLAEMMAAKAAIIKDEVAIALADEAEARKGLEGQYKSFQANLLPNLTPDEFADIYAETITYGMFAARFHDDDLTTWSRQEAMEDLPASNPFLKGLFEYIAGPALPKRLTYIVDDLVAVMRASDPHSLFEKYGQFTARNDPFVHFYEDFLAAYNPKKRKSRGVWYTPEPVVDFIVRAVDDVLKTEFGLADGLADTSKVTVDWDTGTNDPRTGKPVTVRKDVHKVQILDPATGTGTFLAKAVQLIADRVKARAPGKWSGYVEQDLLPRLHGFELLMASYAMCHMKLDMQLAQSGYMPSANPPRLSVWLTNALEPAEREVRDLFFAPLAEEARGASEVKRQTPIMCVIGNPPYSKESSNKGDHIMGLMEAYKMEPGGKERLKERNPKWVNDDYVKFIRMAEDLISKNPSGGVLGFITNHGYLDNPTFRGMRWHLLRTFDKIWVIDLHGNAKKGETSPDGSPDKNVFDIQQGVALIIAVRKERGSKALAELYHGDLWGTRKAKGDALWSGDRSRAGEHVDHIKPYYFLRPLDAHAGAMWNDCIELAGLFSENCVGVVTANDEVFVGFDINELRKNVVRITSEFDEEKVKYELYRPYDKRLIYYDVNRIARAREPIVRNFFSNNFGMIFMRPTGTAVDLAFGVTEDMIDQCAAANKSAGGGISYQAPLYLYPDETADQSDAFTPRHRTLNLDPKLYAEICAAAGIDPADQAGPDDDFRAPTGDARASEVKLFDYIYGVLHAPAYRETFAEFLKIDFPRIPFPPSPEVFARVSERGEALRRLHLMEPAAIGDTPFPYHGAGDDVVAAGYPKFELSSPAREGGPPRSGDEGGAADSAAPVAIPLHPPAAGPPPRAGEDIGRVYINADQYFADVPQTAWEFHIGGYQPAQKWLKDRRGRMLSWDDIGHYQRIVKILIETDRIMRGIDLPIAGD
ncbi:type ISP restriction/modification enzyme [Sphingomonas sp.]|uniref:type ISP restriction/modification enzyme n=1 Tax=Sphingomonas sp. TaxID=28214 RepID=UPI001ED6E07B|nr:type ISP restriction/modification enzyme [Sphingomonas sp.]MBX3595734.1 N-6 DNA methylase [Sphingomonas sp.]